MIRDLALPRGLDDYLADRDRVVSRLLLADLLAWQRRRDE